MQGHNSLTGTLPSEIVGLTLLRSLSVGTLNERFPDLRGHQNCCTQSTTPSFFYVLLQWVDDNRFTGTMPEDITALTKLSSLILGRWHDDGIALKWQFRHIAILTSDIQRQSCIYDMDIRKQPFQWNNPKFGRAFITWGCSTRWVSPLNPVVCFGFMVPFSSCLVCSI